RSLIAVGSTATSTAVCSAPGPGSGSAAWIGTSAARVRGPAARVRGRSDAWVRAAAGVARDGFAAAARFGAGGLDFVAPAVLALDAGLAFAAGAAASVISGAAGAAASVV